MFELYFDTNMRIACLMEYDDMNYKINKIYCDNLGIDLIMSSSSSSSLEKKIFILKELKRGDYEYMIWMGSESHFYVDSPDISELILNHLDKCLLFSDSGVFIMKNETESTELLKAWDGATFLFPTKTSVLGENVVCFEYGILDHFDDNSCLKNPYHTYGYPFVVHYGKSESMEKSRKYYESLSC